MKYQKIIQAKNNLDILIESKTEELVELKYKSECISQTLNFMDGCDITPHESGRGDDNGERKTQHRGLAHEIYGRLDGRVKPSNLNEIMHFLNGTDFKGCTMNSVSGTLTLMTQSGKLGRIKHGRAFHYFINKEV